MDSLAFNVFDGSGAPLSEFHGTLVIDGEELEFTCPGSNAVHCASNTVAIREAPRSITAEIESLDSAKRASVTVAPTYEEVAPNGRECGPICRSASIDLALE